MAEKGKKYLLIVGITTIVITLLTTIINLTLYSRIGDQAKMQSTLSQGIVRFILTLLLAIYMYKGYKGAKVISQILLLLAAIFGLIASLIILAQSSFGYILLVLSIIYGVMFMVLIVSEDINIYITEETVRRNKAAIEGNDI